MIIIAISSTQFLSIVLVLVFLFLGFRILETNWSYRISKPFAWDEAVKNGTISPALKKIERFYRDKVRFYTLWFQVERLKREKISGAFAEVGVYQGETARMIHLMDPSRTFHLFDTFEGFAAKDLSGETLTGENRRVDFSDTTVEFVRDFIKGNGNLLFHAGYFPDTANGLNDVFALVHLDADLCRPTLAALQYFYPRLVPGGVMIIHDYHHIWPGIKKALNEFMPGVPESLVEISDWQGSVMLIRNTGDQT